LERLPDLRPATPPEKHRWLSNVNLRGLVDLPVRFTPERPAPRTNVPRPTACQDPSPPPTTPERLRGFLSMFGFRDRVMLLRLWRSAGISAKIRAMSRRLLQRTPGTPRIPALTCVDTFSPSVSADPVAGGHSPRP